MNISSVWSYPNLWKWWKQTGKGRHADTKKFNQELDCYIREMKLYGENYDKAYRDMFLKTTKLAMPFHAKDKEKLPYFQFNE